MVQCDPLSSYGIAFLLFCFTCVLNDAVVVSQRCVCVSECVCVRSLCVKEKEKEKERERQSSMYVFLLGNTCNNKYIWY